MKSIAEGYGRNSLGIILTGMGDDGTQGAEAMKKRGAIIFAQDEASSCIFGIPRSVIDAGYADAVICLNQMVDRILSLQ
ncbi:MAG: hypothetical protein IME96_11760 [Proteobacteria bacterium]|nr:hypothetical protein [Pseudomonadota bacterium]